MPIFQKLKFFPMHVTLRKKRKTGQRETDYTPWTNSMQSQSSVPLIHRYTRSPSGIRKKHPISGKIQLH
jgi:hypothetical protein